MGKLPGLIAAGVLTVSLVWAGVAYANNASQSVATVVRVIDGDTLEAKVAGRITTIRLLNVDTPETKDPNRPPECLGQEATEFLSSQLPSGNAKRGPGLPEPLRVGSSQRTSYVTVTTPADVPPIACMAAVDRSRQRPAM